MNSESELLVDQPLGPKLGGHPESQTLVGPKLPEGGSVQGILKLRCICSSCLDAILMILLG